MSLHCPHHLQISCSDHHRFLHQCYNFQSFQQFLSHLWAQYLTNGHIICYGDIGWTPHCACLQQLASRKRETARSDEWNVRTVSASANQSRGQLPCQPGGRVKFLRLLSQLLAWHGVGPWPSSSLICKLNPLCHHGARRWDASSWSQLTDALQLLELLHLTVCFFAERRSLQFSQVSLVLHSKYLSLSCKSYPLQHIFLVFYFVGFSL